VCLVASCISAAACHPSPLHPSAPLQEGRPAKKAVKEEVAGAKAALQDLQEAMATKARQAGEAAHGGASAATATAANAFLAQGGETQGSGVPEEVAEAAAARTAAARKED